MTEIKFVAEEPYATLDKLEYALEEYQKYNTIRNDLDAYLFALGEYALGESITNPDPKDYGIKESM